ncbi:hypothetical protein [Spirillospora sp. CA-294931]|uniref:hypothetical protein n=1 Tax=Spirillospora sp. CA-294931 TaxID=3240042 RepID=UPI003D8B815F
MSPKCARCDRTLVPIAYGLPGPELHEAAQRGEVHLGGCMPMAEEWWCGACRAYVDPDAATAPDASVEEFQLYLVSALRSVGPGGPETSLPAPYNDQRAQVAAKAKLEAWLDRGLPKVGELSAVLGSPLPIPGNVFWFGLPLWPDLWFAVTADDARFVTDRRFVRREARPMRSLAELRPWNVLLPEAEAFLGPPIEKLDRGGRENRTFRRYRHGDERVDAYFVYDLLVSLG